MSRIKDINLDQGFNYIDWEKEDNLYSIYDDCSFYNGTKEDLIKLYNDMILRIGNEIVKLTKEV